MKVAVWVGLGRHESRSQQIDLRVPTTLIFEGLSGQPIRVVLEPEARRRAPAGSSLVSWSLIPDGVSTIVDFEVSGEFTVSTTDAEAQARRGMIDILTRLSGVTAAEVEQAILEGLYLGDVERPKEEGTS